MKLTNQEIEQYGDEYASKSYSADANPIDYEMLKQPFMDGMKKALDLFAVSGSLLLYDLLQVADNKNEDGMPIIKYIDKPNGGGVAYVRHDAMVNKLNTLLKQ